MHIIGVDAGGTWVKVARFSSDPTKISDVTLPSGASGGIEAYFDSVAEAVRQCGANSPDAVVGLAIPGTLTKDRRSIKYAANIKGLGVDSGGVSIAEQISKRLGKTKVAADNDAKCAALAEWALGLGKGDPVTYLLHVTWGTGIGTGFVADGRVSYGWEGGHLPVAWTPSGVSIGCKGGCRCACGSTTDIESHTSVPLLVDRAHVLLSRGGYTTRLTEADFADRTQTSKVLSTLAVEGDALAQELLRDALAWLARGLHSMAILAYPDIVTVGGAMMGTDWLLAELREAVRKAGSGFTADTLKADMVQRAQLGNEAGVIGAAVLARSLVD